MHQQSLAVHSAPPSPSAWRSPSMADHQRVFAVPPPSPPSDENLTASASKSFSPLVTYRPSMPYPMPTTDSLGHIAAASPYRQHFSMRPSISSPATRIHSPISSPSSPDVTVPRDQYRPPRMLESPDGQYFVSPSTSAFDPLYSGKHMSYSTIMFPPRPSPRPTTDGSAIVAALRRPTPRGSKGTRGMLSVLCSLMGCWGTVTALVLSVVLLVTAATALRHSISGPIVVVSTAPVSIPPTPDSAMALQTNLAGLSAAGPSAVDTVDGAASNKSAGDANSPVVAFRGAASASNAPPAGSSVKVPNGPIIIAVIVASVALSIELINVVLAPFIKPLQYLVLRLRSRCIVYALFALTAPIGFILHQPVVGIISIGYIIPAVLFYLGTLRGEEKVFSPPLHRRRIRGK